MEGALAYWTKVVRKERGICSDLLRRPLYLAGIEIVVALDNADLRSELAELGLTSNLLRDLGVIFMNSVGERVALFSLGRSDRGLNIADQ